MNVQVFQQRLRELSYTELERFVFEVLKSQSRFADVVRNERKAGFEIDVMAQEFKSGTSGRIVWLFEVKSAKIIARDVIEELAQKAVMMADSFDGPRQFVLVVAVWYSYSALLAAQLHGTEVWDSLRLADECPDDVATQFFGEPIWPKPTATPMPPSEEAAFEALLQSIEPGQAAAAQFQTPSPKSSPISSVPR